MAVLAGSVADILVGTSSPATNAILPMSVSFEFPNTFQEETAIGDTFRSRVLTMKDFSGSMTIQHDTAITGNGQIITAALDGSDLFVRILPNGSAGYQCACKIDGLSYTVGPDGITEFSFNFIGNAAVSTI